MKKVSEILVIILLVILTGCGGGVQQSIDDIIVVDIKKSYSSKKELILQDFMDVEYIALETNDDFVNQGFVQDIGQEFILVRNRNRDGDIFVYDRTGNAISKINHQGQSGEEYTSIFNITLDENNREMFVNDVFARNFVVYDLFGKFKRSFNHKKNPEDIGYRTIFNYDSANLICYDEFNEEIPFVIISKQDGSITQEIKIPFKEKKFLSKERMDGDITYSVSAGPYRTIIPFTDDWMLLEVSSDTVYKLLPDYSLCPFIIRTPSVQSMDPEVMLILRFLSNHYYFFETIDNVFDFNTNDGFPRTFFMYDNREKDFFRYAVYNGDYTTKKEIYMNMLRPVNHEIESWQPLEAYQLVESYNKGELKDGKLKEIASKLDKEDNPVIMLVKHKK